MPHTHVGHCFEFELSRVHKLFVHSYIDTDVLFVGDGDRWLQLPRKSGQLWIHKLHFILLFLQLGRLEISILDHELLQLIHEILLHLFCEVRLMQHLLIGPIRVLDILNRFSHFLEYFVLSTPWSLHALVETDAYVFLLTKVV